MGRNDQFIRQHVLLRRLGRARYGCTLDELRLDLEQDLGLGRLSSRTVRRDLQALQVAGYGVDALRTPKGVVWTLSQPDVGAILATVSADELAALLHCRRLLADLRDGRAIALASLLDKLRAAVTDATWRAAELRLGDAARVPTGIQTTGPKKSCRSVT